MNSAQLMLVHYVIIRQLAGTGRLRHTVTYRSFKEHRSSAVHSPNIQQS